MRPTIKWADVSYTLEFTNGEKKHYNQMPCFAAMRNAKKGTVEEITIRRTKCKSTIAYHDAYLQYVAKMFKLDVTIGKNSFKYTAFRNGRKNMLVASTIRLLFEPFCTRDEDTSIDIGKAFFWNLLHGKRFYKDDLKHFCYHYSRIKLPHKYTTDLHTWLPSKTIIKSTKQFMKKDKFKSVNGFFYTEY